MNTGKIAGRTFLILFVSGIALGLFLIVVGNGIAAEYMDQGGGGLAALFGLGLVGLGYLVGGGAILMAGIPWVVIAIISWVGRRRSDNSDENDLSNAESSDPKHAVDSDDAPKA